MITDELKNNPFFKIVQEALRTCTNFADFKEKLLIRKEYDITLVSKELDKSIIIDSETGKISHKICYNKSRKLSYIYNIEDNQIIGPLDSNYIRNNEIILNNTDVIENIKTKIKESINKNYSTF